MTGFTGSSGNNYYPALIASIDHLRGGHMYPGVVSSLHPRPQDLVSRSSLLLCLHSTTPKRVTRADVPSGSPGHTSHSPPATLLHEAESPPGFLPVLIASATARPSLALPELLFWDSPYSYV